MDGGRSSPRIIGLLADPFAPFTIPVEGILRREFRSVPCRTVPMAGGAMLMSRARDDLSG